MTTFGKCFLFALVLLTCCSSVGQTNRRVTTNKVEEPRSVPQLNLQVGTGVPTSVPATGIFGPIQCEGGSIYFRPLRSQGGVFTNPVVRVASTGSVAEFTLDRVPDLPQDAEALTFAIDSDGSVYEIVRSKKGGATVTELIKFSRTQELSSRVKLDFDLYPSTLIVLPTGEYLLEAFNGPPSSGNPNKRSTYLVLDQNGKVARTLAMGIEHSVASLSRAISGNVRIGSDGNLYAFNSGASPRIGVYETSGRLLKNLRLELPFAEAEPMQMLISGQRILVIYQTKASLQKGEFRMVYSLYDAQGGNRIADYSNVPAALACFDEQEFTFLKSGQSGTFSIARAAAR